MSAGIAGRDDGWNDAWLTYSTEQAEDTLHAAVTRYKRVAHNTSWIAHFATYFHHSALRCTMSNVINKAGMKLFSRHLEHYTPEDPLYEEYVDKRGRTKRRKVRLCLCPLPPPAPLSSPALIFCMSNADAPRTQRQLPPGLSDRDAAILRSVKRRAHHLDKGFSLCGVRFGWSFIIGSHHHSTPPTYLTAHSLAPCECLPQVLYPLRVTQQMPYSATSSLSARPAEPSMCPPLSPFPFFPTRLIHCYYTQDTVVAHATHVPQPCHRDLCRAHPCRR